MIQTSKANLSKRLEGIESRTVVKTEVVHAERTEPFSKFKLSQPVMDIIRTEDGRLQGAPRLLTVEEIQADPTLSKHPKLTKILEEQARYIEQDKHMRKLIFEHFGGQILEESTLVVDGVGNHKRLEYQCPVTPSIEEQRRYDNQVLFNIYEYGSTPAQAVALAYIQLCNQEIMKNKRETEA